MAFFVKTTEGLERLNGVHIKPSTANRTITANGTYDASDDGVDGYSSVTVDVPRNISGNLFDKTHKNPDNGFINKACFDRGSGTDDYIYMMPTYENIGYISEYIPVIGGLSYWWIVPNMTWKEAGVAIYDGNKQLITYIDNSISGSTRKNSYHEYTMPSNAAYVRMSVVDTAGVSDTVFPGWEDAVIFAQLRVI